MCGIAAAIGPSDRLPEVVRALRHRGPDQAGVTAWGRFALGAARPRITGDSRADQPLDPGTGVVVVANGEVFNHAELRGPGGDPGEGDLAPLARLLDTAFPDAVTRIRGPFALAALDRRTRMLMLARDEHGVRPLHVAAVPGGMLAASEIWPLVACLDGEPRLDGRALAHLLAFQFLPPGRTAFRDIASVRPGEVLVFDEAGRPVVQKRVCYAAPGAAPGDLGRALREAAILQGARSHRAAVFLSGGVD
jgi:asparagine synthase (glutamine-hydrolysing)